MGIRGNNSIKLIGKSSKPEINNTRQLIPVMNFSFIGTTDPMKNSSDEKERTIISYSSDEFREAFKNLADRYKKE